MRKLLLSFAILFSAGFVQAQTVTADFEALPLAGTDTFYINTANSGADMGFDNGSLHFPYVYDTSFGGYWASGFAYTNKTDSVTGDETNMYAAKAGKGGNGSAKYVTYNPGFGAGAMVRLTTRQKFQPLNMQVTNSTYTYNSMRDGDRFAKKFGGVSGNDSDFYLLTVYGWSNGQRSGDSVNFYLADYRFSNNSLDYLVRDWRLVSLAPLGYVDSISFNLRSSDSGPFGMNTPAYFCMDNLSVHVLSLGVPEAQPLAKAWPNPAAGVLNLEFMAGGVEEVRMLDMSGRLVSTFPARSASLSLPTGALTPGTYVLQFVSATGNSSMRFVKQ